MTGGTISISSQSVPGLESSRGAACEDNAGRCGERGCRPMRRAGTKKNDEDMDVERNGERETTNV